MHPVQARQVVTDPEMQFYLGSMTLRTFLDLLLKTYTFIRDFCLLGIIKIVCCWGKYIIFT